jgi:diaminopropionate ammonia-lyase
VLSDLFRNHQAGSGRLPASAGSRPAAFHRSMERYQPSPLVDAPRTAQRLGLRRLLVKLELDRLGLPSFKVLGASWAVCRLLCRRAGLAEPVATFDELRAVATGLAPLQLVAATDGNHGRAVAHMARLLGLDARILVPAGMARARIEAIAAEGAAVDIVEGSYDTAVAAAAALGGPRAEVVSDTSWPGYADVPRWVSEGYATIFEELAEQLDAAPDISAVQIGVGALAAATAGALGGSSFILGVEPADAACVLAAVRAGAPQLVPGPHRSVMAGLNCGVASEVALPALLAGIPAFCAIEDSAVETVLPWLLEDGIACGETGAAGVAGLLAVRESGAGAWSRFALPESPVALALCTEGPTDPESVARLLRSSTQR